MPEPVTDAAQVAMIRSLLPTSLGSSEIRAAIAADLRARSVWAARMGNATVVSKLKEVVDAIAAGDMNLATARVSIVEALRAVGYTPEGGFPDDAPGEVPEANISATGLYVRVYNAAIVESGFDYGNQNKRIGSTEWQATRTVTGGAADPLFFIGTSAPA